MSRIGKLSIPVPGNIQVSILEGNIVVKGPKGELTQQLNSLISVNIEADQIQVTRVDETKPAKSMHGLYRTLIANMIKGVSDGYQKRLEIHGVGYRASVAGKKLNLAIGFSHPVEYVVPSNVDVSIDNEKKNVIVITGIDKQAVGQVAAEIRSHKKPEPYKGKGIRYEGERIIKKAGKTSAK